MVAKMGDEIRKAVETLGVLSGSKKAKARYEMRLKARRDHKAEMDWAYDDGLEKGLERGRAEGLERGHVAGKEEAFLETARKLKNMGLSAEQISAATGLPPEALE